jgi:hypothetical protein
LRECDLPKNVGRKRKIGKGSKTGQCTKVVVLGISIILGFPIAFFVFGVLGVVGYTLFLIVVFFILGVITYRVEE